jgi:antitoxin component of RelBE/YafQ-DinJ toxin-antitoxin module
MIKEKDILIRITPELKEKVQEKAKLLGLSLSSYVRMILIKEVNNG